MIKNCVCILLLLLVRIFLTKSVVKKKREIHTLLIMKTPSECEESKHNEEIILSLDGKNKEMKLGKNIRKEFGNFLSEEVATSRNVYAISPNTSCHYQSTYHFSQSLLFDEKREAYQNIVDFFPTVIERDHSDSIFQLRTCDILRKEAGEESYGLIMDYKERKEIKEAINIIRNIKAIKENGYLDNLLDFERFEKFYNTVKLNHKKEISDKELYLIDKLYELFMYSHYFSNHRTAVGFLKPFIHKLNQLLGEIAVREEIDGELKTEKKVIIITLTKKMMFGIFNSILGRTHKDIFKQLKEFITNTTNENNYKELIEEKHTLVVEIFNRDEEKVVKGFNFLQIDSLILKPYGRIGKRYAIEARLDGKVVNMCGPFVSGQCLLIDMIEFFLIDFYLVEAKYCRIIDNLEREQSQNWVHKFMSFSIILLTGIIVYLIFEINLVKKEKEKERRLEYHPLKLIS